MSYLSKAYPEPIVSMFFEARLWFDKYGGNTYHSVRIHINGKVFGCSGMEYGYENQYQYATIEKLVAREILPKEVSNLPVWRIANIYGIHIYTSATYGKRSEMLRHSLEEESQETTNE